MKKYLMISGLVMLTLGIHAQTKNNRFGFMAGGGSQKYRGDLGNGFNHNKECWTGGVSLNAAYYINTSFDAGLFGFMGDFGFCQPKETANKPVDINKRCPGCVDRVGLGNLNSRMTSGGFFIKYKLNNNFLLKENSLLKPYVYAGVAFNNIKDRMKMKCVNPGNYFSINSGAGIRYYFNERINIGYNVALGYFTSDKLDFMTHDSHDMYMQNTLFLGIDLF